MNDDTILVRNAEREVELDAELHAMLEGSAMSQISVRGGGEDWDAPLDLRVARPRATDLRAVWAKSNAPVPPQLAGALSTTRPILLTHTVTPFAVDGRSPTNVWALGYEFVAHGIDANTLAVAPRNEVYKLADLGQTIALGIDANGGFGIADHQPGSDFTLHASASQRFQFEVSMTITLRKVIGAPVGIGGAVWKMYRQNEPLDQPHTMFQLILVPEHAQDIRCIVKAWAVQAGWFGTSIGKKFWAYEDQPFKIKLT